MPAIGVAGDVRFVIAAGAVYVYNGTVWAVDSGVGIGAIDGQPAAANGATVLGTTLYMQSADATHPGLVNNAAQTISGAKTFSSTIVGNVSGSAASFTGSLVGDVTGTQGATTVATVGTSSAANVHAAELLANAATNTNTASTIVKRDASGNFSAGTIGFRDTSAAFDVTEVMTSSPALTAGKTLTFNVVNGNRTLNLGGNLTLGNDFITSGNFSTVLTVAGATNVSLPTTGTLATLAGNETFTNKVLSGNTAATLISGTGTLTLNTSGTVTVPSVTDTLVGKATTDTLTNKTISGASNTLTVRLASDVTGTLPSANGGLGANASAYTGLVKASSGVFSAASLVDADVSATAAIALSKLAAVTSGNIVIGNVSNVATSTAVTGDITITNGGATTLASAISGSKTWNDIQTWKAASGTVTAGTYDATGACTFGPSGSAVTHMFNGALAQLTTSVATGLAFDLNRTVNTPSRWEMYLPIGSTDMRLWNSVNGDIVTLTQAGAMTVKGATSLGAGNTGILVKIVSGTTGASQGAQTSIAHGITSTKIVSIAGIVFYTSTNGMPPAYTRLAGYEYSIEFDGTNIYQTNSATNSSNILSKTFDVVITYTA